MIKKHFYGDGRQNWHMFLVFKNVLFCGIVCKDS